MMYIVMLNEVKHLNEQQRITAHNDEMLPYGQHDKEYTLLLEE